MCSSLLEIDDITKDFDNVEVLSALSFSIASPGVVAILGPSGSGKSTLLRIIAGLIPPSSGRVIFNGKTVLGADPDRILIFQQYALFPWATAHENLTFGMHLARNLNKTTLAGIKHKADELLDHIGLSEFSDYYPNSLSGGMQQRIAIARALALSPALLLMDEPFGALDSVTKVFMHELVRKELALGGKSAILVTHDIDDALALAHTIYILSPRPATIVSRIAVGAVMPDQLSYSNMRAAILLVLQGNIASTTNIMR